MSLVQQIPPQSYAFGKVQDGVLYVDIDWYLFLFNIATQTISANGTVPASQSDMIDMVDLDAAGADLPQAYRDAQNVASMLPDGVDLSQTLRAISNLEALESSYNDMDQPDSGRQSQDDNNVQLLQTDPDAGPSLREVANALIIALDALQQDPVPLAQPAESVTVGVSPFSYSALFDGLLSVTSGTVSDISIIRQGTTVATGITAGIIPARRGDQVQITYTVAPTAVFLPD